MKICGECSQLFDQALDHCPEDGAPLVRVEQSGSDPLIGCNLDGRYDLESVIGRGAMGVVYLARQVSVDRPVAVKVLRREFSSDRVLVARVLREAKALSLLHHPNLLTIFDFGQSEDGRLYVATELLEGNSVARLVREKGPLTPAAVSEVLRQVAEGLVATHGKGIVHRDLKPENLFLVPLTRGRSLVKVLDFGIAQVGRGKGAERLTHVGGTVGTPAYMSPEQIRGQEVEPSSDVYSLGCVAYRLLTGEVPFSGQSVMDIVRAHLGEAPVPPSEKCDCPRELSDLLLRMLAKDPADRPADAEALLDELEGRALSLVAQPAIGPRAAQSGTLAGLPAQSSPPASGRSRAEGEAATHVDPVGTLETEPHGDASEPEATPAGLLETLVETPAGPAASDPDVPTDLHAAAAWEETRFVESGARRGALVLLAAALLAAAGILVWVVGGDLAEEGVTPEVSQTVGGHPAATLTLESQPSGASVLRLGPDGEALELGRTPVRVPVGLVVRIEKRGYLTAARDLSDATPNETLRVELVPNRPREP